jgi:hypothetical protein
LEGNGLKIWNISVEYDKCLNRLFGEVAMSYWQKRDAAKGDIEYGLRRRLIKCFRGQPVIQLREKAEEIRAGNKTWVKDYLKFIDAEDIPAKWVVFFSFEENEEGRTVIKDFSVIVETN